MAREAAFGVSCARLGLKWTSFRALRGSDGAAPCPKTHHNAPVRGIALPTARMDPLHPLGEIKRFTTMALSLKPYMHTGCTRGAQDMLQPVARRQCRGPKRAARQASQDMSTIRGPGARGIASPVACAEISTGESHRDSRGDGLRPIPERPNRLKEAELRFTS
jgi:hypothetical protein